MVFCGITLRGRGVDMPLSVSVAEPPAEEEACERDLSGVARRGLFVKQLNNPRRMARLSGAGEVSSEVDAMVGKLGPQMGPEGYM